MPATGDDQDKAAFREAMGGVTPLKREHLARHSPHATAPKPRVKIRGADSPGVVGVLVDQTDGEYLQFAGGGMQHKVLQRLKRGEPGFTARLDLHGHTEIQAEHALSTFLSKAAGGGDGCVLIIHGKGLRSGATGGVLKRFTADWLKNHRSVKAFCSAQPRDGGTGAVYVLLR